MKPSSYNYIFNECLGIHSVIVSNTFAIIGNDYA